MSTVYAKLIAYDYRHIFEIVEKHHIIVITLALTAYGRAYISAQ